MSTSAGESHMQLTVVGCSGSYPGPDSPASCYLVQAEHEGRTWNILMDLGNGALGALHRYVDPLDIDAVFLSHLHADHCIDMTSYYVLRKYHPTGEQEPLPVWGPRRTARRLARAYDLPKKPGMREEFVFHRLRPEEDPVEVGPFSVTPYAVDHPVEAYAFRVQVGDRVLAYSGDTGPCTGFDQVAAEADLLLAEASFVSAEENPPSLHLTGAEVGETATRAGAARVVLTHVPPWHDPFDALAEAKSTYDGPLELASAGAVYDV
ncbi:MBL fold metallo-hydrolase [Nocardioides marinus]|jgi:ribonuclease BN (tRNA processing enzyme)|uniref:Ribonuclease BN (tRNA processing enzyme) n=1 Tax=Nocardioides marinus TaxID=374514 RepID=A0A7Y9YFY2_9ACTN|nr:MBL fold metallo-hydrolase [Nocardioides marinus]NYI10979.1 ribonuclease BN (tRNA processing enzyme) [Nocardioides marinus]